MGFDPTNSGSGGLCLKISTLSWLGHGPIEYWNMEIFNRKWIFFADIFEIIIQCRDCRMFSHVDLEKLMMDKSQHNNPYSPCRGMT